MIDIYKFKLWFITGIKGIFVLEEMCQIPGVTHKHKNTDMNSHTKTCTVYRQRIVQEASQGGFRGNTQVMVGTVIGF